MVGFVIGDMMPKMDEPWSKPTKADACLYKLSETVACMGASKPRQQLTLRQFKRLFREAQETSYSHDEFLKVLFNEVKRYMR